MTDKILIDRAVVEQALMYLGDEAPLCSGCVYEWAQAIKVLRAALEQQPVSIPDELPSGFVPLQREKGRIVYAACLDGSRFHGWLMWKHPDGQWVSKRKLEDWEIMQAEDQRDYGIVQGD